VLHLYTCAYYLRVDWFVLMSLKQCLYQNNIFTMKFGESCVFGRHHLMCMARLSFKPSNVGNVVNHNTMCLVNIKCLVLHGVSAHARFSWEVEVYLWNTMNTQIM